MDFINKFFLNEGVPEGLLSPLHIFTVTFILVHMLGFYVYLGFKYKNNKSAIEKVLKVSAFIMIGLYFLELLDSFLFYFTIKGLTLTTSQGWFDFLGVILINLPFYLCDIAIFAIPLIAFTKGKIRTILSDFLAVWGIPMGIIGTYLAGNVFVGNPVITFDGLLCIYLHVVPASVTLFLYITKIATLEKKNIFINLVVFTLFMGFVLVYDILLNPIYPNINFMFFIKGDGTPFDLFRPYVPLFVYQIIVFVLYLAYTVLFFVVYNIIAKKIRNRKEKKLNAQIA